MRIAVACDHAGFLLKDSVISVIQKLGYDFIDFGTFDQEPIDYPDIVEKAATEVAAKKADRAIIICGSGVGACVAANKVKGVYASICHDTYSAHQAVEHDNLNVLCLGGRVIGEDLAMEIVSVFLNARFSQEERHLRRFKKIQLLEDKFIN